MTNATMTGDLEALRLPELQAKYAEIFGEPTKCPNRKSLIRRISERVASLEATAAAVQRTIEGALPEPEAIADEDDPRPSVEEEALTKMDIHRLRALYEEVVGRPTNSMDQRYIVWKIRQARKGKVTTGARTPRATAAEHQVLPVRVPKTAVPGLDAAWKRMGMKSRTEFFLRAIHAFLYRADEKETAAAFAVEA